MPKRVVPLTDLQIRNAKRKAKPYKLADGGGLYLEVMPSGSKLWRLKYRQADGRENRLSFGAYPEVGLADARDQRLEARKHLTKGDDPGRVRDARSKLAKAAAGNTFELVAREWHRTNIETWQPQTAENILHRFETDIFPAIGREPIADVDRKDLLAALRAIEKRGAREVARRLRADCARIFQFAIESGYAERDPSTGLSKVLLPREDRHFATISAEELPVFLSALSANEACMGISTRIAMRLMLLVFVRTSELIETPWSEIDFEKNEWIIPWQRMKRGKRKVKPDKRDHNTCVPRQGMDLLRRLRAETGGGVLLFPNMRDYKRPMSNMALLKALERMGYKGDMTGHGFRALAMSTLKEKLGYRHEVVDRQLAHAPKDKLESAYDRAQYLDERRAMMQAWADYLDVVGQVPIDSPNLLHDESHH